MSSTLPQVWLVCVMNKPEMYKTFFTDNPHCKEGCHLVCYDNCTDNQPIPVRYNDFLDHALPAEGWVAFCHQDFRLDEDIRPKLLALPKDCIYGVVGTKTLAKKAFTCKIRACKLLKASFGTDLYTEYVGRIKWLRKDGSIKELHRPAAEPAETVDTLEPCLVLLHTDLIRKYQLRFDPFFDFHIYAEELSVRARLLYGVQSKVFNLQGLHYSKGFKDENFYNKYIALVRKYPNELFSTLSAGIEDLLIMRRALGLDTPKKYRSMLLIP